MRALAGVVLALAACGDSLPGPVDGPPVDASGGVVRVRVRGAETAGHRVFFQNPDSSLVLATRTAPDGTANAYMPPGGFVTLLIGADLWTWSGVEPGDELVLPGPPPIDPPARVALRLSVPPDPDATSLWLHTPCTTFLEVTSARVSPLEVLLPGCERASDLLVVSRKVDFSTIAHFTSALDVQLGTPDEPAEIAIAGPWLPPQRSRIAVANVPVGGFKFLYAHQEILGANGVVYDSSSFSTNTIDVLGSKETFATIPLPADARLVTYVDDPGSASGRNLAHLVVWGPPSLDTVVDLDAAAFPKIVQVPLFERGRFTVSWRAQAQQVVPEASLVTLQLATGARWTVLAAADAATTIAFPVVPLPTLSGELLGAKVVSLISLHSSLGYAAYRGTLLGWSPTESWPISTPTGHVSYVQYLPN